MRGRLFGDVMWAMNCIRLLGLFEMAVKAAKCPVSSFLVLGLFKGESQIPKECIFWIQSPEWLFWKMWWNIILLHGFGYIFSLKGVQGFRLYNASSLNL
jgi:hypothetical protein